MNTGEVVELFDGGWVELGEGLPHIRVIVARHPAPAPDKEVQVGKGVGVWVDELFLTNLDAPGFLAEELLDLYHGRGAEDRRACRGRCRRRPRSLVLLHSMPQELWQIVCQGVSPLRLSLGHTMQGSELRDIEWTPPKEAPPFLVTAESPSEEDGPWQWAAASGPATGLICAEAFVLQENGTLRWKARSSLWRSSLRQENAFPRACCLRWLSQRLPGMGPEATGLVGSVPSAASCPRLRLSSLKGASYERDGGWMW